VLFCIFLLVYGWFQHKAGEIRTFLYILGSKTSVHEGDVKLLTML
jgi:hypothetical protein